MQYRTCGTVIATALLAGAELTAQGAPRTRLMDELNWMEFAEVVPARVKTVILTVGTLEPHGVANNGADGAISGRAPHPG